jgi:hypothetical protein
VSPKIESGQKKRWVQDVQYGGTGDFHLTVHEAVNEDGNGNTDESVALEDSILSGSSSCIRASRDRMEG